MPGVLVDESWLESRRALAAAAASRLKAAAADNTDQNHHTGTADLNSLIGPLQSDRSRDAAQLLRRLRATAARVDSAEACALQETRRHAKGGLEWVRHGRPATAIHSGQPPLGQQQQSHSLAYHRSFHRSLVTAPDAAAAVECARQEAHERCIRLEEELLLHLAASTIQTHVRERRSRATIRELARSVAMLQKQHAFMFAKLEETRQVEAVSMAARNNAEQRAKAAEARAIASESRLTNGDSMLLNPLSQAG
eukprot:COSAG05_NODE_2197_length_3410_cov_7.529447_2_plen_252_part_00